MHIPRPFEGENQFTYSRRIGRGSVPQGAAQHYDRIRMPHPKPKQSELRRASIDLVMGCKGDRKAVIELASDLIQRAIAEGRQAEAKQILKVVKEYCSNVR